MIEAITLGFGFFLGKALFGLVFALIVLAVFAGFMAVTR